MAKAIGADILSFYDAWPMGREWYHDDCDIEITGDEGEHLLDPTKKYDLDDFGTICWQGDGDCPERLEVGGSNLVVEGFGLEFGYVLRAWLKATNNSTFSITVPKDQVEALKALAKERGWKLA